MKKRWYETAGGYFCLPRAIRYDDRLSHTDIRILLALASFVFQKDAVFPSRELLQAYTGIETSNISKRTKRLAEFGWLKKDGKPGGRMTYKLLVPAYALERQKAVTPPRNAKADVALETGKAAKPRLSDDDVDVMNEMGFYDDEPDPPGWHDQL